MRRKNELDNQIIQKYQKESKTYTISYSAAFEAFIKDCESKNLRPHTIRYYTNELRAFYKSLKDNQITTDLKEFSDKDLKVYINPLNNPVRSLKLLKNRKDVVQTYTNKELKALFNEPNVKTFTGVRDLTIMMMFLEIGARANELISIKVSDLDLENSKILLTNTKGYKQRFVQVQKEMQIQIKYYLKLRGKLHHDYLWVNINNEALSKQSMMINVSNYGKQIGIKATCHKFRHNFGRIAAENGASIFEIQAILGHSSLEMVR